MMKPQPELSFIEKSRMIGLDELPESELEPESRSWKDLFCALIGEENPYYNIRSTSHANHHFFTCDNQEYLQLFSNECLGGLNG